MNFKSALVYVFLGQAFTFHTALATEKLQLKVGKSVNVKKNMASQDGRINCDFPEPTDIRDVARAFSLWFDKNYVVDDSLKAKVRLFSPEPVSHPEAMLRFQKMLAEYHLKEVDEPGVTKIEAE